MGTCCKNSEGNNCNYCEYLVMWGWFCFRFLRFIFWKHWWERIVCSPLECSLKTQSTTGLTGIISVFLLYFICRQLSPSALIQKKWHPWKYWVHYKFRRQGEHAWPHYSLSPPWLFIPNGKILKCWKKRTLDTKIFNFLLILSWKFFNFLLFYLLCLPCVSVNWWIWSAACFRHYKEMLLLNFHLSHGIFGWFDLGSAVLVLWVADSPWGASCAQLCRLGLPVENTSSPVPGPCLHRWLELWVCSGFTLSTGTWDGCCQVAAWLLCAASCSGSSLWGVFKALQWEIGGTLCGRVRSGKEFVSCVLQTPWDGSGHRLASQPSVVGQCARWFTSALRSLHM